MAELIGKDGTWTFDGDLVRIVPGTDRGVHKLRRLLGEVAVPLEAVAGIAYEAGKKGGRLRLRLRDGACPLQQATGGALPDDASPYQVKADSGRTGVAEYFADEVRRALLLEQIPDGPADRYLIAGPSVPLSGDGLDGTASFDGETVRVEWNWLVEDSKKHAGNRVFTLQDLVGVEWSPATALGVGALRFKPRGLLTQLKPDHDPNCLALWGFRKESGATALIAAAVTARLPHPAAVEDAVPPAKALPADAPPAAGDDHDAILRRLRELGELHREGVLTDDEFAVAKQAVLGRLAGGEG
ncbi:DUF4429 domain-containing protein [Streptomyces sp. A7024]|uniref:DUF4429 domain-containing protein n=1 Tax=Streptomyces coryli TaxID=1128680 RepID=A0A6G4TTE5_9ACTN|nr:DUF4429 domain-containing protein [Streptomyces coryli]NGN63255.1 DUF4429 domain-containing protein [Streptomyces coryli]